MDSKDTQLIQKLSRRSTNFRRAMGRDKSLVDLAIKSARTRVEPKWAAMDNNDPTKREFFQLSKELVLADILKERPEAKSILGSILLGVIINLIVKAIIGYIT